MTEMTTEQTLVVSQEVLSPVASTEAVALSLGAKALDVMVLFQPTYAIGLRLARVYDFATQPFRQD